MKLDPKIVAQGWLDLLGKDCDDPKYAEGIWASEIVSYAVECDLDYALEILDAVLEIDSSNRFQTSIEICIIDEIAPKLSTKRHPILAKWMREIPWIEEAIMSADK